MRRVETSWKLIETVLKEHAHSVWKALRRPATEPQIDRLQKAINAKLPRDLIGSLRIHDGMDDRDRGIALIDYMRLLPSARIISDWQMLWDLQRECNSCGDQATRTRKIKNDTYWRAGWVPIMDFEGDKVVLDLDPGPGGRRGQIIRWYNYGGRPMRVLAESWTAWLDQVAEALIGRSFTLSEWGDIHLKKPLA